MLSLATNKLTLDNVSFRNNIANANQKRRSGGTLCLNILKSRDMFNTNLTNVFMANNRGHRWSYIYSALY